MRFKIQNLKSIENPRNKGFTLIETLIAVTVLSFAITGPMYIAQKGIEASIYARDEITASYLAQEAIEYIRFVRDSNKVKMDNGITSSGGSPLTWLSYITSNPDDGGDARCSPGGSGQCSINALILDYFSPGSLAIRRYRPLSTLPFLAFRTDTGYKYYGYNTGTGTWSNTGFKRWITVSETIPDVEAVVSVKVSWNPGVFSGVQRIFTVKEYIYNY